MKYVVAYDLGTGGAKASLVSQEGEILKDSFISYKTYFSGDNWQEQRPDDWWNAIVESTHVLLADLTPEQKENIVSVAISGHSLGVVPIGKDGSLLRELTPIWSDQRAEQEAEEFFKKVNYEQWYMTTGNGFPAPCYSVFKIMWYKRHEAEMFARVDKIIGTKDYCNYKFTGVLATDHSYASGSGVYNLKEWCYEPSFIEASGLSVDIFPHILPSDGVVGRITPEVAALTGLPQHVQVVCGGVDNSCMALGAKGNADGRVYTSLGSSAWIALVANEPVLDIKYKPYVFAHILPGMYASATCIFSAGSSFQWVRNQLCKDLIEAERQGGENSYAAMDKLALNSTVGANGVVFNPSLAGGSSIEPTADMSGGFAGLRLQHTREDIIRASMEGVALNLRKALDVFRMYYPDIDKMLVVGGGAKSKVWMQMFADIYNTQIEKTNIDQQAATFGAAALAFNGVGVWSDYQMLDKIHKTEALYSPSETASEYESQVYPRFEKLTSLLAEL